MSFTIPKPPAVSVVILAAGMSTRMGRAKMLLPWGHSTVIETVVESYLAPWTGQKSVPQPLAEILVVVGAYQEQIKKLLQRFPVRTVYNPQFSNGEMLVSLQAGLKAVQPASDEVMVTLGDQPGIQNEVLRQIIQHPLQNQKIVFPSYQNRRGHPWKFQRTLIPEILELAPPQTLRDFMSRHTQDIGHVEVSSPQILLDLDTPEDYQQQHREVS